MQTLQAFSLTKDQENYDPNVNMVEDYQLPVKMGSAGISPDTLTEHNTLSTKQLQPDAMLAQLLQQMQTMQAQISSLSSTGNPPKDNGTQTQVNNPKTGQPWRR